MEPQKYITHKIYDKLLPKNSMMLMFFDSTPDGKSCASRPHISQLYKYQQKNSFDVQTIPGFNECSLNPEFFYHGPIENKIEINSTNQDDIYLHKNRNFYIDHSFEPIQFESDNYFWNNEVFDYRFGKTSKFRLNGGSFHCIPTQGNRLFLLHSERHSDDIIKIRRNITVQPVYPIYWFANGYLCATEWYRHYNLGIFKNYKNRPIKSKFVSLNRLVDKNKKHRIQLLNLLDLEHGVYSLPSHCPYTGRSLKDIMPENNVKPNSIDGHPNESAFIDVKNQTPINTSFLHVVTETLFTEKKHHLTEKTFKPIVLQQPFVLVAPHGCLGYLKSYGFKTFDRWWDESYDKIEDDQQRLQAIADVINNISKKDYSELYDMQGEMSEVLEHNHRLFYGSFATDCWHELQQNIKQFDY